MSVPRARTSRSPVLLHGAAALGAAAAGLVLGGRFTLPNLGWYDAMAKPTFGPPPWSWVPIWTLIYVAVGLAMFRILRQPDYVPDRRGAVRACVLLTALFAGWPGAFFAARNPFLGLVVATALIVAAGATVWRFAAMDRAAAALILPTVLWAAFLVAFDLSTVILNA